MEPNFETRISVACSKELAEAHGDPERISVMIEKLASSLSFAVAVAARGDPRAADTLLEGVIAYLYEAASGHAKFGEFMSKTQEHFGK